MINAMITFKLMESMNTNELDKKIRLATFFKVHLVKLYCIASFPQKKLPIKGQV